MCDVGCLVYKYYIMFQNVFRHDFSHVWHCKIKCNNAALLETTSLYQSAVKVHS